MTDRTKTVFGNPIDRKTVKKAEKSKAKYQKKYGDDTDADYRFSYPPIERLGQIGARNIVLGDGREPMDGKPLIVGNIRMGFGHYRISIAMASCARALGFTPYWLDLASFDATGSKMIREQNDLYSLASRISQRSRLFNRLIWEPLNSEGFKKITYNAKDQKNSELLVPLFKNIDKDVPFIATHVWPSQAAVHAGMTHVVNAIPDNWPMGLHLSEGAIHAVQTPFAYLGYKTLEGFAKTPLKGIPEGDLYAVGPDPAQRRGAGAGGDLFLGMIEHLTPYVERGEAALFINTGDHAGVYERLKAKIGAIGGTRFFQNDFDGLKRYAEEIRSGEARASR